MNGIKHSVKNSKVWKWVMGIGLGVVALDIAISTVILVWFFGG